MRAIYVWSIPVLLLFSCSANTDEKVIPENGAGTENLPDSVLIKKDFPTRFSAMINTFGSQDMGELNKFISPEFGLLILESHSGAMPQFHIQKTDDIRYRQQLEAICNSISFDRNLKEEALPRIDCDSKDFYTKSGSFVQDTNLLSGSEIWKYGNLAPEDQVFAERVVESIGKTVVLTSGYTFYFTYYKDSWYLTVIDARKPCQA